jgi:metallo-beta-lactamase family protein
MKITFHGGAGTVTGSKHLIETDNGERILLDFGMFQGLGPQTPELNREMPIEPNSIDFVILSHAHVDHSGLLPLLWKRGYRGPIFATPATKDLCSIMLADSAYIQEADVRFVNKRKRSRGQDEISPLYNIDDANGCMELFEIVPYDIEIKLSDRIRLTFSNNGHIPGSAAVHLKILEGSDMRSLTFTGDIGRYDSPLLKDPASFPQADILICESTYGNRLHDPSSDTEQQLLDAVLHTCGKKRGKLIIPAFSLGRTQEIVYTLNRLDLFGLLPDIKIFVDSPLSTDATRIIQEHEDCLNDRVRHFIQTRPDPFEFGKLFYITEKRHSQALNDLREPCVIISASGMAEAGRVKHHIMHNISNPKNTILLVGYAEPQSLAARIKSGDRLVTIFNESFEVKAEVMSMESLSAHGDYEEMKRYLGCQNPQLTETVFLVHGQQEAQENWKTILHGMGYSKVIIPQRNQSFFA